MSKLTEIGIKYNTDKATDHKYTYFYEKYISHFVNPTLLEIGVYNGASLKMWEEYFGDPKIVGLDIEDKSMYATDKTKIVIADQGNADDLKNKCTQIYPEYDIIIDDGSHIIGHQISTLVKMFPTLKSKGVYILEDLHTSFIGGQYNPNNDMITAYDFLYRSSRGLEMETPYASKEEMLSFSTSAEALEIFQLNEMDFMHSITSVIIKK